MTETRRDGSARRSSAVEEPGQERLGRSTLLARRLVRPSQRRCPMLGGQACDRAWDGVLAISEHLRPYA
jgi:hypothetical protein